VDDLKVVGAELVEDCAVTFGDDPAGYDDLLTAVDAADFELGHASSCPESMLCYAPPLTLP
jgi:hypothetical protein